MIDPTRTYSYRDICQDWVTVGAKHNYTQVSLSSLGANNTKFEKVPVPPYVPATVLTVVVAIVSDKIKLRGPFVLLFLPIAIVGWYLYLPSPLSEAQSCSIGYIISIVARVGLQG